MKITENLIEVMTLDEFADKHDLEFEINERNVSKNDPMRFYVNFKSAWLKEPGVFCGASGNGATKEIAIKNYKQRISNQCLVFNPNCKNEKRIYVPCII